METLIPTSRGKWPNAASKRRETTAAHAAIRIKSPEKSEAGACPFMVRINLRLDNACAFSNLRVQPGPCVVAPRPLLPGPHAAENLRSRPARARRAPRHLHAHSRRTTHDQRPQMHRIFHAPPPRGRPPMHSPDAAAAQAAAWLICRDRGLTPGEQDAFHAWLAADQRHGEAFARECAAWRELDLLAA